MERGGELVCCTGAALVLSVTCFASPVLQPPHRFGA
jgi:hypothetical protein